MRIVDYLTTTKHYQVHLGFNSEMLRLISMTAITKNWGHSSAGRAPAWHAGGQRFESAWLHYDFLAIKIDLKYLIT